MCLGACVAPFWDRRAVHLRVTTSKGVSMLQASTYGCNKWAQRAMPWRRALLARRGRHFCIIGDAHIVTDSKKRRETQQSYLIILHCTVTCTAHAHVTCACAQAAIKGCTHIFHMCGDLAVGLPARVVAPREKMGLLAPFAVFRRVAPGKFAGPLLNSVSGGISGAERRYGKIGITVKLCACDRCQTYIPL